ncbi:hypothetical protein IAI15_37500, partial [Escherichia coli]|nr:hypothetical protein [Escherichia coli]
RRIAVGQDRTGRRTGGLGVCRLPDRGTAPDRPGDRYASLDGKAAFAPGGTLARFS